MAHISSAICEMEALFQDDRPQLQYPNTKIHFFFFFRGEKALFCFQYSVTACLCMCVEWTPFSVSQTPIGFVLNKLSALCTLKEVHLLWRVLSGL